MKENRLVVLLGLAGFIVMADNWVVSPILPAIAKSLGVQAASAGVLIAAYMLPFGLFQLIFGPLADRYGKSRIVLGTLAAFTVATGLCATGATLTGLAVFRALTGVFAAATMPISLALIGDAVPMERRQQAIGSFMGISFLGQALSMGIGGAIAYFLDWRGVFVAYAVFSAAVTVVLWRGLADVRAQETRNPEARFLSPYAKLVSHGPSARTYAIILLEGIFLLGSFSYLGTALAERYGLTFLAIGGVMTAFGIAAVIGGRTSGKIAARLGRRNTAVLGLATAALADGLVLLGAPSLLLTAVGIFALGFGFMTAHSTLLTIATEFAEKARGAAMSLVTFCFMLGGAIGTSVGGRIATSASLDRVYLVYGVGLALLALLAVPALAQAEARQMEPVAA
ncbi:MFS transporter [Coriobacteriia bacterium Es71-Z0120]|uniref:MFS transporter n=1 Tax=Parvivirga hydrogeniphila TaxID=2939460 RepID=UPI002260DDC9|nr:MFS transporter [Parvivirga hydrogeniphila]MCL4078130.1 MFS transporter [Parvivirga hydrogeniphila]